MFAFAAAPLCPAWATVFAAVIDPAAEAPAPEAAEVGGFVAYAPELPGAVPSLFAPNLIGA